MADIPRPITDVEIVRATLRAFYHGRPVDQANQIIRRILSQYGGGAARVSDLDPKFYDAVYDAAGGKRDNRSPLD